MCFLKKMKLHKNSYVINTNNENNEYEKILNFFKDCWLLKLESATLNFDLSGLVVKLCNSSREVGIIIPNAGFSSFRTK